jgi:hypothetical protein
MRIPGLSSLLWNNFWGSKQIRTRIRPAFSRFSDFQFDTSYVTEISISNVYLCHCENSYNNSSDTVVTLHYITFSVANISFSIFLRSSINRSYIILKYLSLAEMPGVAQVDHRTKCVSLVAISLSQNFETRICWPAWSFTRHRFTPRQHYPRYSLDRRLEW